MSRRRLPHHDSQDSEYDPTPPYGRTHHMPHAVAQPHTEYVEFPSPFMAASTLDFLTLKEFRLRALTSQILEKPNWWQKVHDETIVAKWRQEFVDQDAKMVKTMGRVRSEPELNAAYAVTRDQDEFYWREFRKTRWPRDPLNEAQLDYVFDNLRWLAEQRDANTGIQATGINKVYQSFELIPSNLKAALIRGASVLESVPDAEKDWHPGTNNQVLDLVHPSLFCFRIGKSLVKKDDGMLYVPTEEEYMEQRPDIYGAYFSVSTEHQWLPTDFDVSSTGAVTALNYINNLHPDLHKPLINTITAILRRFIPLWDRVLSATLSPEHLVIKPNPFRWYEHVKDKEPKYDDYNIDGVRDRAAYRIAHAKYRSELKWPLIPDPPPFTPPPTEDEVRFTLKGRKIQVIVKMANIILTPENPKYEGGSWHVEGMENERIVSTGLYYYHSSNISESKLGFRQAVGSGDPPHGNPAYGIPSEQNDDQGYMAAYGIDGNRGFLNQELGTVITKEDKCLAFPNIYQHRVAPFELVDSTKPGVRKILCFFLVDPTITILSTSKVPPQQHEWYLREIRKPSPLTALPLELFEMITTRLMEEPERPGRIITTEQAKEERQKLMDERANFRVEHNKEIFEMEFNMCEH
ncbi:hypothetical protein JAAARDRAFT_33923 [Jaapia argillacea MUCL 33604]|uniref:Uncharacterized protein n=1 Tax=Jaapia argillacea MUCL 33604 TaxID=933084 RepID=A0A067PWU9_9AGAM|nr:hypothetical protein JAAARDRAFT_33923 [Jaapia argillacea MUCL 33604]